MLQGKEAFRRNVFNKAQLLKSRGLRSAVISRELNEIWDRWISTRQLSQHKQSSLSSSEPVRWEKEVYLTLLPVVRDEGRNRTYFWGCTTILQTLAQWHLSDPALRAASGTVTRESFSTTVTGRPLGLSADGLGLPFLSPHLEHGWRLKTIFFPERKFLECFIPYRALSTWSQGLHLLFLIRPYSENYIFLHFRKLQEQGLKHIKFAVMQSYLVKSYGLLLCYIFTI